MLLVEFIISLSGNFADVEGFLPKWEPRFPLMVDLSI